MLLWAALAAAPLAYSQSSFVTTFGGTGSDYSYGVALDGSGNTYVTGSFAGTADFDPDPNAAESRASNGSSDVFLASYDAAGALRYVSAVGGSGSDIGYGVAVDGSGNTYVTGNFTGTADFDPDPNVSAERTSNGSSDVFVASYNATGALRYVTTFGGTSNDEGRSVAVDGSGNVYVTGYFVGTVDFNPDPNVSAERTSNGNREIFLASYDNGGVLRYAIALGSAGSDEGYGVAMDGLGNVYVTGNFAGTVDFNPDPNVSAERTSNGNLDVFVASYNATGALRYVTTFGGTSNDIATSIAVDALDNTYVTGRFLGTADFDPDPNVSAERTSNGSFEVFVASYNATGALRYATAFGSIKADFGVGITTDGSGNVYVTGYFAGTVDFNPDPNVSAERTPNGSNDAYVASYDDHGALRYVNTFGGASDDRGYSVVADGTGTSYVTGYFGSTVDFNPDANATENRTSNGASDAFLFSVTPQGGVLPVELTAFTAALDGSAAVLNWRTASETGNTGFDVQIDAGQGFRSAGWVDGAGTTLEESSYAFRTSDLAPGSYRFRLEQVDLDGATEFSPVVELHVASGQALALTAAQPNPFGAQSSVTLSVGHVQTVRVALYDALGREVAVLHSGEVDGSVSVAIDGASLPAGVYVVRAQGEAASVSTLLTRVR